MRKAEQWRDCFVINTISYLPTARAKSEVYIRRVQRESAYRESIHQLIYSDEDKSIGIRFKLQEYFGFKSDESLM